MSTQVDICNLALASVGSRSSIASLTEGSTESDALGIQYNAARDMTLRMANWNFARKQVALTLLKSATDTNSTCPVPWAYSYAYPSDCIKARFIMPSYAASTLTQPIYVGPPIKFIESTDLDSSGNPQKVLLTNQPQAILVYTFRNINEDLFDPTFVIAFAEVLASRVAIQLTGDKAIAKAAWDKATAAIAGAKEMDGNEGISVQDSVPDWLRVRGYASDYAGYGCFDWGYDWYNPQFPIN